jgi:hypothetical protein
MRLPCIIDAGRDQRSFPIRYMAESTPDAEEHGRGFAQILGI